MGVRLVVQAQEGIQNILAPSWFSPTAGRKSYLSGSFFFSSFSPTVDDHVFLFISMFSEENT